MKTTVQQGLAVFYGKMPESNGKENWTAILYRKSEDGLFGGIADGITIDRSEYPDRVRYEADCVRYLIGEIDKKPNILEYDSELHSGYVDPLEVQRMKQSATPIPIEELERVLGPDREKYGFTSIKGEGYELVIDDNRSVRGYPTSIGGVYFIFRNHDIEKHVPLSDEAIDAVLRIRTALEKGSEAEGMIHRLASHLMINNPKLPDEIINQIDSIRKHPIFTIKPLKRGLDNAPFVWLWLHSYGKCAPTVFETKENAESAWGEFSPGGEAIPLFRESPLKPMESPVEAMLEPAQPISNDIDNHVGSSQWVADQEKETLQRFANGAHSRVSSYPDDYAAFRNFHNIVSAMFSFDPADWRNNQETLLEAIQFSQNGMKPKNLGTNQYGLDMGYLVGKLNILIRDIKNYKPDEAARTLARLSVVADENVILESEFSAPNRPQDRVSKEWSEIWSPIEALVRPVTPLGESIALKAVELIKSQLSGANALRGWHGKLTNQSRVEDVATHIEYGYVCTDEMASELLAILQTQTC